MRVSSWTWPFPFLVRLGWLSAGVSNPPADEARGRVFLLRGNGIVFSGGLGVLCGRLRRAGFWAEDLRCVGDRWLCRRLRAEPRREGSPVVFVGHSCGGRYALHAAGELERACMIVDLVVCVDVAWASPVPANVRRAVHLFRTGPRLYPARPLVPASGSAALIENIDVGVPGLHHCNITDHPAVQDLILRHVLAASPATTAWEW
jgi:hypothetical protein